MHIPEDNGSIWFAHAGLNVRECKESNQESVMNIFKGAQSYGLLVIIQ